MSLTKKIKDLALIASLSAGITGCANIKEINKDSSFPNNKQISIAKKILKTDNLEYLPGGYITDRWGKHDLVTIAGALTGTINISEVDGGYLSTGSYSEIGNPEALIVASEYADQNKDKIITEKESRTLYNNFCK